VVVGKRGIRAVTPGTKGPKGYFTVGVLVNHLSSGKIKMDSAFGTSGRDTEYEPQTNKLNKTSNWRMSRTSTQKKNVTNYIIFLHGVSVEGSGVSPNHYESQISLF
jgi:hypothetical protein